MTRRAPLPTLTTRDGLRWVVILGLTGAASGAARRPRPAGDIGESTELGALVLRLIEAVFWVSIIGSVMLALAGIGYGLLQWMRSRRIH